MNIRDKDLNLLAIFVAIGEELNLSRASGRVGLSQPALSHALGRLRAQFGDPLFVRGQRGLIATPRVSALLPQARAILAKAESLYGAGEAFDLARMNRKVVIACTTYFETRAVSGSERAFDRFAQGHGGVETSLNPGAKALKSILVHEPRKNTIFEETFQHQALPGVPGNG